MQKFTRIAALFLVAVAVLLAFVAFSLGRRTDKPTPAPVASAPAVAVQDSASRQPTVPVVVAAAALTASTPIAPSSLQVVNWPQRPEGGYADVEAVVASVPLVDIPAGTPLTAKLLSRGVAMALKPGERAMAVPVDEQAGAGNRILPGDYVDVFLSLKLPQTSSYGKAEVDGTQTRLLLSRLRVLAYGSQDLPTRPAPKPPAANGDGSDKRNSNSDNRSAQTTRNGQDEPQPVPRTAVLAVPVEQADQLLLGVQNGKLSLAVRHPGDDGLPSDGLFPQPRTVLAARTDLTPEQRQLLEQPENQAYAGINGVGLAGQDHVTPKPGRSHRGTAPSGVEIIRGPSDDSPRATRDPL